MKCRVCIDSVLRDPTDVAHKIDDVLTAIGQVPAAGAIWAVKLNLTYPRYIPGVVNSPIFVEGLCQWARDRSVRLQLLEGNGGNGSYSAEEAFDNLGLTAIAARYGAKCVNVSNAEWEWRTTMVAGREIRLPHSKFFIDREFDAFITAPLFKNHVYTFVSLGMKNLWGCIPDAYRMYYHHFLDYGIVALQKELQPTFSLFDGLIGSRGRGPMDGNPVDMNCIMAASTVGAGESAGIYVMGVDRRRVRHVEIARQEGLVPELGEIEWVGDPALFRRDDFVVDRSVINHLSIMLAKSPLLMRLVYHSPISKSIYSVVNAIRGDTPQVQLVRAKHQGFYRGVARK